MGATTGISWTDSTWNPWWGCQKVGPGCDHCYAEGVDLRAGGGHWGPGAERRRTGESNWNEPLRWQKKADAFQAEHGHRRRVFCGSMMDIMDNAVPLEWARDAFVRIASCVSLDWQLLTKRVGNVEDRVPPHWRTGSWPRHVGLMITVVDQKEADRDIPKLLDLKDRLGIPWVGLSMEPLLGPVDLTRLQRPSRHGYGVGYIDALRGWTIGAGHGYREFDAPAAIDWIITGGESGPGARPANPDWYRSLRDQAAAAQVPFFFKQWGEWMPRPDDFAEWPTSTPLRIWTGSEWSDNGSAVGDWVARLGIKHDPQTLDGVAHHAFPRALEPAHV